MENIFEIKINGIQKIYSENLAEGNKISTSGRVKIKTWNNGCDIYNDKIYFYCPKLGNHIYVFDLSLNYNYKFKHSQNSNEELLKIDNNVFYFTDFLEGKVNVYRTQ